MATITLTNGNTVETGAWLGGWHGWTNNYSVVDIAVSHGMVLDPEDAAVVEWYRNSGESDSDASDEELDKLEGMTGQGGITDRATDYLQELLPAGWTLRWDDGLTLLRDYEDCAADGGGCDVEMTTVDGSYGEIVTLCPDHTPEDGE